jgi:predicted nucleic acid-binding protein
VEAVSNPVVVDSSVAYKWLSDVGEESVVEAREMLDSAESGAMLLAAPATLHVELANALRYSCLEPDDAVEIIDEFESFHVELFEPTTARLHAAAELAYLHNLSVYDALFLALAEELGCAFVTADRRAFAGLDTGVEIRLL